MPFAVTWWSDLVFPLLAMALAIALAVAAVMVATAVGAALEREESARPASRRPARVNERGEIVRGEE